MIRDDTLRKCPNVPFRVLQAIEIPQYSITCIKRPIKGSNESGLIQQVVFKCRFYKVDLRRVVVSEQWSFKAGGLLIQVVSSTGLTVLRTLGKKVLKTF